MPQSFHQLYGHLIFSTKHRRPILEVTYRPRIHAFLATICRDSGCPWVVVGGVADHVHIAMDLGKQMKSIDLIARIKKESSLWIKSLDPKLKDFYWQDGYGLFSFSALQREAVENYIKNQESHHQTQTFQEEFISFLERYKFPYDEKYLWD
ncbi:IS200/IS605 family transposase [Kiritimatiellaeota bacterium B1221]|nr:IS200/IS605 family transposase [Kiritimatiellaeota bacterium B1221]